MNEADRAYERALSFLENRDRTEREMLDKLKGAGFSEEDSLAALERLKDAGLVDDNSYAERYLAALIAKGHGRLRISAEMRRKGLKEELVRNTLEDGFSSEDEQAMAAAAARRCLEGMQGEDRTLSRKAAAKVNRRLVSLGFSYAVIGSAMRDLRTEKEDEC